MSKTMINLKKLNLKQSALADAGLVSLMNLPELEELDISECHRVSNDGIILLLNKGRHLRCLMMNKMDNLTDEALQSAKNSLQLK